MLFYQTLGVIGGGFLVIGFLVKYIIKLDAEERQKEWEKNMQYMLSRSNEPELPRKPTTAYWQNRIAKYYEENKS